MTEENKNGISNDAMAMMTFETHKKSAGVAYFLWFFFGLLGIHRFYFRQFISGFIMLGLTVTIVGLVISGIWWVIDLFLIPAMAKEYNKSVVREIEKRSKK